MERGLLLVFVVDFVAGGVVVVFLLHKVLFMMTSSFPTPSVALETRPGLLHYHGNQISFPSSSSSSCSSSSSLSPFDTSNCHLTLRAAKPMRLSSSSLSRLPWHPRCYDNDCHIAICMTTIIEEEGRGGGGGGGGGAERGERGCGWNDGRSSVPMTTASPGLHGFPVSMATREPTVTRQPSSIRRAH